MAYTYSRPCPSAFGADALETMAQEAQKLAKTKAFLCCDSGVMKSGGAKRVADALATVDVDVMICDKITPDPTNKLIDEVAVIAKEYGPDLILGVGGGSAMDTAKGLSIAVCNEEPIANFMMENGYEGEPESVTVYLIPTAAGTGSEASPLCVLHDLSDGVKKTVIRSCDLAVLDPMMTMTCPRSVTVNSALDALSHAIEAHTCKNYNPWSTAFALESIRLIAKWLPVAVEHPDSYDARAALLFAANIAGDALTHMNIHIGHVFAHEAGVTLHMPHGYLCGLSIPETIRFCSTTAPDQVREVGKALGVMIPDEATDAIAGEITATWVRNFMAKVGVKGIAEYGATREQLIALAAPALENNWFHVGTPGGVTVEQMQHYCADIFDNYQVQ